MVAGGRAYVARLPVAAVSGVPSLKFASCRIIRRAGPGTGRPAALLGPPVGPLNPASAPLNRVGIPGGSIC